MSDLEYSAGRIDISKCSPSVPFNLQQELGVNSNSGFECSIKYIHEASELSDAFFSRVNIELLHERIISEVNIASGTNDYKIARQSEEGLEIVMRAMYLQNGKNLPVQIGKQVRCLNKIVIEYCVKNIIVNIKSYIGYIRDIQAAPSIQPSPISTSSKCYNSELQPDVGFVNFSREIN
jgi:hypothetical protein